MVTRSAPSLSAAVGLASGGGGLLAVLGLDGRVAGFDPDVVGSLAIMVGVLALAAACLFWTARGAAEARRD